MELGEEVEPRMFAMGDTSDYDGFQDSNKIHENFANTVEEGRDIEAHELLNETLQENDIMFDRDLGESSEDEQ